MGRIISILGDDLRFLGELENIPTNGAQISTVMFLRQLAKQPWVEAIEYFLLPDVMAQKEKLAQAARSFLPPERRGQGVLRFYAFHSLPEVWNDGAARNIFCFDPELLALYRYVRDRYATGPAPISTDTHTLGHYSFWKELSHLAPAPPVAFDTIVCRTPETEETLREGFAWLHETHGIKGGELPCRLDRISHGVDLELFHPVDDEERAHARRVLGLPEGGQITMFFGRINTHSKADLMPLLRCFAEATQESDDYLLLAGTPTPEDYLQKLRGAGDELGLDERLILHGHVEPTLRPLYYAAADLFVFPGDNIVEVWAQTMIEAMASGVPIIASDWDGLRTHMEHGISGFSIPTWWMPGVERIEGFSPYAPKRGDRLALSQNVWIDTVAFTSALQTLLRNPEARREMGANGRRLAEERYDWKRIMEQWRALWEELESLARHEQPAQAQARRDFAQRITFPVPYLRLFKNYATGVIQPERHYVRLSARAETLLEKRANLGFYEDMVPMLRQDVVETLFYMLRQSAGRTISIGDLTRLCAAQTGVEDDLVRFHIGLLLKHALVEISEAPGHE